MPPEGLQGFARASARAIAGRAGCNQALVFYYFESVTNLLLTGDEYRAMAVGLADTEGPATGSTALSQWLAAHNSTSWIATSERQPVPAASA